MGARLSSISEEIVDQSGGGITDTARALLISILRNGVYSTDQSANITALNAELAKNSSGDSSGDSGETTSYTVVNNLENVENSNSAASVSSGSTYVATLSGTGDCSISRVSITMGGVDITATAWDAATATITVAAVTGDIIITATAKVVRSETLELVYGSGYPNVTTFEYTEQATAGTYVIAKQGELRGGSLSVEYDPAIYNNWNFNLYVFDAGGNPYVQTDSDSKWNDTPVIKWEDVGAGVGFGVVSAPFNVQIPDGCTFIACMRRGNVSTGTGTSGTVSNSDFSTWGKSGGIALTVTG